MKSSYKIAAVGGSLHFLAAFMLLYHRSAGEPDSINIICGIYNALLSGKGLEEPLLYFRQGQPLYYQLFFFVPGLVSFSFDTIIFIANMLSCVSSAITTAFLYLICRRFASIAAAVTATTAVATSLAVFELSTYAHPVTVSIACFMAGGYLLLSLKDTDARYLKLARTVPAVFLIASSILLRADVVMLLPLITILCLVTYGRNVRLLAVIAIAVATSLIVSLAGHALMLSNPSGGTTASNLLKSLLSFHGKTVYFGGYLRGLAEMLFITGAGYWLLAGISFLYALRTRNWRAFIITAGAVAMPLFLAAGNPLPARRFLHATYAGGVCMALLLSQLHFLDRPAKIIGAACLLAASNLFLLPLMRTTLEIAGFSVRGHELVTRATDSIWKHHSENQQYINWESKYWKNAVNDIAPNTLFIGDFQNLSQIIAGFCRNRQHVKMTVVKTADLMIFSRVAAGSIEFYFAESLLKSGAEIPRLDYSDVFILYPYSAEQRALLPTGVNVLPPSGVRFGPYYTPRR